jgi:hypothetical protein
MQTYRSGALQDFFNAELAHSALRVYVGFPFFLVAH